MRTQNGTDVNLLEVIDLDKSIKWKLVNISLESNKIIDDQVDVIFYYEAEVNGALVSKEVLDTVDIGEGIVPSDGLGIKPQGSDHWVMLKPETDDETIIKICNSLNDE